MFSLLRIPLKHLVDVIIISAVFMVYACSVPPEKDNVKDTIISHFNGRNYTVVRIEIDAMEEFPLGRREYMAPKKYTVHIPLIQLRAAGDDTDSSKPPLTFRNASITISSTGRHGVWMIDMIRGIPLT